jgi:EF-hand domain-containing family member B
MLGSLAGNSTYKTHTYLQDTSQQIPAAGVLTAFNESAKECLTWQERPATPPEIKKYRQSAIHEPSKTVRHFGVADDPVPAGPYGRKSVYAETAEQNMKAYPQSEIAQWRQERSEDIYARYA